MKIFEIANTLLDVIKCIPSLTINRSTLIPPDPRDVFNGLSCLLASLCGSHALMSLLQAKMTLSSVPFEQMSRPIEINDESVNGSASAEPTYSS
jgi:hypothetical protein